MSIRKISRFLLILTVGLVYGACSEQEEEKVVPIPQKDISVKECVGEVTDVEGVLLRYARLNAWYVQTANRDTYMLFLESPDHEYNIKDELKDMLIIGAHVKVSGKVYTISEHFGDYVPELKELIGQHKAFGMVAPDITIKIASGESIK